MKKYYVFWDGIVLHIGKFKSFDDASDWVDENCNNGITYIMDEDSFLELVKSVEKVKNL